MIKNFKTIGLSAMLMTAAIGVSSCSGDDDYAPEMRDGAIKFGAVVPKPTKAASTTTTSINDFMVYAFTAGKPYMDGVKVVRNGSQWGYSPVAYWPNTAVNFYAYSPEISNQPIMADSDCNINDYTSSGQTDLLYAVNIGETAKASPVLMNFRHALSRVDVMLSSDNPDIVIKVAHVSLTNLNVSGSFKFPNATTSAALPYNVGAWSGLKQKTSPIVYYSMEESDFATLTKTPVNLTENNLEVSFFIPQALADLVYDNPGYSGNAIQIDCQIFDAKTGAKIWPNSATPADQLVDQTTCGKLMYPVTTAAVKEWEIGHAYVYNVKIDNPEALHPIEFDVTVEDFTLEPTE